MQNYFCMMGIVGRRTCLRELKFPPTTKSLKTLLLPDRQVKYSPMIHLSGVYVCGYV